MIRKVLWYTTVELCEDHKGILVETICSGPYSKLMRNLSLSIHDANRNNESESHQEQKQKPFVVSRAYGVGFKLWGIGFRIWEFRAIGFRLRFRVWGLGCEDA